MSGVCKKIMKRDYYIAPVSEKLPLVYQTFAPTETSGVTLEHYKKGTECTMTVQNGTTFCKLHSPISLEEQRYFDSFLEWISDSNKEFNELSIPLQFTVYRCFVKYINHVTATIINPAAVDREESIEGTIGKMQLFILKVILPQTLIWRQLRYQSLGNRIMSLSDFNSDTLGNRTTSIAAISSDTIQVLLTKAGFPTSGLFSFNNQILDKKKTASHYKIKDKDTLFWIPLLGLTDFLAMSR